MSRRSISSMYLPRVKFPLKYALPRSPQSSYFPLSSMKSAMRAARPSPSVAGTAAPHPDSAMTSAADPSIAARTGLPAAM